MEDRRKLPSKDMLRLMHEMKAVQKVVEELMSMEPRPEKIKIKLGRMMANPQVFGQMFREFVAATQFSGIDFEIEPVDVVARCGKCGFHGRVDVIEHVHFVRCPDCKKVAEILKGNELEIV